MSKFSKILVLITLLVFSLPNFLISAQLTPQEEKQILEKELLEYEKKISQYEKDISKTQQERRTLQNQISILRNRIKKLDLQIQQSNLMIRDVGLQIKDTEGSIKKTSLKIEKDQRELSKILRTIYQEGKKSLIEILLLENNLSDFFNNLIALENLNNESQELLNSIKSLKTDLENQKQALDEEKDDLERMLKIQVLQRTESAATRKEREGLLEVTKGRESEYQKILAATKKRAAEIRARIFELIGVPEAPTFGEALEIARYVARITDIRPAFLLAIIEQESSLGKNVGQCYLKNPSTGQGVFVRNKATVNRVMNPRRDVPHFLRITQELGRDPYKTLVSCPMKFGWGGAMGPAQFIPSTWARYRDRVKAITGKPADPWNIRDSFLAAGLKLADYGATAQTRQGEWRAAMIYFSGTTNPRFKFYGDSVLRRAERIKNWIEDIEKAG